MSKQLETLPTREIGGRSIVSIRPTKSARAMAISNTTILTRGCSEAFCRVISGYEASIFPHLQAGAIIGLAYSEAQNCEISISR